ncbi:MULTISPECIES: hypothetical protein [unclassified Microcystis]|nr:MULTISPECIES: hypothetical protein [unclassified Microcystis]MCA2928232.1 hypothetical protein [Microcystis sp. M020S1]MCA2934324.1 hypothetical protein [Microcystis sp. M015S1]MCA2622148.1 hypothetical protein [Microcystis sp. M099S2]MCA2652037.1 hypothetical protein [Microcystis sp. M065S2]MCA2681382.1 hypothetical protein [Microcystis sp. M043S2]
MQSYHGILNIFIVRLDKMKGYNQINLLNGYGILTIISPLEVTIDEANDN